MKSGSDNFRSSSIVSIMNRLKEQNIDLLIYEDLIQDNNYLDIKVEHDINIFKEKCDLIIANRMSNSLKNVANKVFTRDLFGND